MAGLKESLSIALVQFYPWAGKIIKGPDGRSAIDCNDSGVEMVQASIDLPFTDLGDDFQFKPYFTKLVRWGEIHRSDSSEVPLLSVQVTKFLDGGISLGISQNHVIADGHSLWHFLVSWAECARGVPISKPPVHDRTVFKVENPSPDKAYTLIKLSQNPIFDEKHAPIVERVFFFSGEMIKQLKYNASKEGTRAYTSYEALCAHVWKSVTKARELKPDQDVHTLVLVNCRRKMNPPVPDEYFGNVIVNGMVITKAKELLGESLGATAQRIHDMIELCNEEALWAQIHYLELRDNYWGVFKMDSEGLLVASSPRFPIYEVDFGWGPPTAVRPSRCGGDGEMVLFMGRQRGGFVDVCLKLEKSAMDFLENDPDFLASTQGST